MNITALVVFLVASATVLADTVNFDDAKTGALPNQWLGTQTGSGAAKWAVEKADDAPSKPNVLKQAGEATFPVCIKKDTNIRVDSSRWSLSRSPERKIRPAEAFS
jgi:hypothetical protein